MSETFTVPPGCQGVSIEGTSARYGANPTGHISVDNPAHAAKIKKNGAAYFHKKIEGFTHVDGNTCPTCKFRAFAFTVACPRCGTDLKPAPETTEVS